jgi:hypothetical protein
MARRRARKPDGEWRRLLVAHWDHRMTYWRISRHLYPQEIALRAGDDVVVCTATLASALEHAGRSSDQFDDDDRRVWLLCGADDSLTLVEDHHVPTWSKPISTSSSRAAGR